MKFFNEKRPIHAFPSTFKSFAPEELQIHSWGMTLLDYLAAKAMLLVWHENNAGIHETPELAEDFLAKQAYRIANAMMRERERLHHLDAATSKQDNQP